MIRKTIFSPSSFKPLYTDDEGVVYGYSFPVYFYNKTPTLYAQLVICGLSATKISVGVFTADNEPYSHWYVRDWGQCTLIPAIEDAIVNKVRRLTNNEYDISWQGVRELQIRERRRLKPSEGKSFLRIKKINPIITDNAFPAKTNLRS